MVGLGVSSVEFPSLSCEGVKEGKSISVSLPPGSIVVSSAEGASVEGSMVESCPRMMDGIPR